MIYKILGVVMMTPLLALIYTANEFLRGKIKNDMTDRHIFFNTYYVLIAEAACIGIYFLFK